MENELKPCPFCGREAFVLKMNDNGFVTFSVVCEACHASTNGKVKERFAIEAWNCRVGGEDKND